MRPATHLATHLAEESWTDLRHAVRSLRREPALVAAVLLTFTLAVGANAAMLALVRQLMLAPPPGVADAARVVRAGVRLEGPDDAGYTMGTVSYPAFRALGGARAAFADVAASRPDTLMLGHGAATVGVAALAVTGRYFAVLGARPHLGRLLTPADDAPPDGVPVVVLGHAYWRRLGADRRILGTEIELAGAPHAVVGVAPPGFHGDRLAPVDLFVPLNAAMRGRGAGWREERAMNVVSVVARLRDGVDPAAARAAATAAVVADMADEAPDRGERRSVELESLVPGEAARQTPAARTALWLAGVAAAVLLVAVANVATLLLLRAERRRRDAAVRAALGVSRGRFARQLLTESVLLALAGAAAGLLVSRWIADAVRLTLLPGLAPPERLADAPVALATLLAACAAGVLAGLAPLAQLARRDVAAALHETTARASSRQGRAQRALVVTQVALCTLLVAGAGLFVRSLHRVSSQDLGFSTARLLFVTLDLRDRLSGPDRDVLHHDLARRLAAVRGVTGATVMQASPFGMHHIPPISVPGLAEAPTAGGQLPLLYAATPEYLRLLRVRLREGRLLGPRDGRDAPLVVLVNETMARAVWPGRSAVGRCIRFGFDPHLPPGPTAPASLPCREVVGVVADSRARSLRPDGHEAALMQYYVPMAQMPAMPFGDGSQVGALLVETAGEPAAMVAPVQRLLQGAAGVPLFARVRPYQELLEPQLRPWRLGATLFTALGALALGIGVVGLSGVVSYRVTRQTREIGVRLALGGERRAVAGRVVAESVAIVGAGVAAGLAVALMAAPLVQPMLFQTSARDVVVLGGAAVTLLLVAVVAATAPAWRASRVSPLVALRAE